MKGEIGNGMGKHGDEGKNDRKGITEKGKERRHVNKETL